MTFAAPTGFLFTGTAVLAYYADKRSRGEIQQLSPTYSADHKSAQGKANPHLNTSSTDRTLLQFSFEILAQEGAAKGEHGDGEARIGGQEPVKFTGDVI